MKGAKKTLFLLGVEAHVAETLFDRLKGLIGVDALPKGRGLLIRRCNCIHTLFMRFPIDATFLDRQGRVVRVVRHVKPWRLFVWGGFRSVAVLETASSAPPPNP